MNPAFCIADDMLVAAAKIDDLDEALRSVMDQVGITEGDVAGLIFASNLGEAWPTASKPQRFTMLDTWRAAEQAWDIDYQPRKEAP